nr:immunoglobulin light chain junction region [Macaca mulatta]MOW02122.1 immunoglobulin light chain junction region [Macaca mulatta]MOW02130.1 immunoglobulin light chain junction region [Macaca mulatta]MOW02205.1 immunoglobulin light chain junction region [Macaca mulatta]MOW02223.1 immunoglobulin light chain junction region [Macaca mulatta]
DYYCCSYIGSHIYMF